MPTITIGPGIVLGPGITFAPIQSAYFLAVAGRTTPFVEAYPWSSSGFGTKYSNPATLPAGNGDSVAFGRIVS